MPRLTTSDLRAMGFDPATGQRLEPAACSQCGQSWSAPACGPTHAMIAAKRLPDHLREPAKMIPAKRRGVPNKLEENFMAWLRAKNIMSANDILFEPFTLHLGGGCKYTPDVVIGDDGLRGLKIDAYEVKPNWSTKGATASRLRLKIAADRFPWITFYGVTWDRAGSTWRIERVSPEAGAR